MSKSSTVMLNIRKPSISEINVMNKDTLKTTLKEIINSLDMAEAADEDVKDLLKQVLDEIKAIRAERNIIQDKIASVEDKLAAQEKQLDEMKEANKNLLQTISFHQKMFEKIDSKERSCNVIIMGVKEEDSLDGATTDKEKCLKIFEKMQVQVEFKVKRICNPGRFPRPLLVITNGQDKRELLLQHSKRLKDEEDYKHIYVKKDVHPAVRREWKRLKEAESQEKDKPENAGCDIKLDFRKRELLKDGEVIDKWQPSYFQ